MDVVLWCLGALVALSAIWSSHLNRREIERTVRLAIESGQPLDADIVRSLKARTERGPEHFLIAGLVLIALAAGVLIFAVVVGVSDGDEDALISLSGIAAILLLPGVTLAASGVWLMRRRNAQTSDAR